MNTKKIYELLEDFFGKDSNVLAFYNDAYFILNNSDLFKAPSHLIGYCLREIESAILNTLLPEEKEPGEEEKCRVQKGNSRAKK